MNPLDWFLVLLLAYSTIRAAFRGFVREAFALGGLLVGFLTACWGYEALARKLANLITSPPLAQFVSFLLILLAIMALATLLGHLVKRTASAVGLGLFDRLAGALFGLVRGAVLAGSLLLAITAFLPAAPWVAGSKLSPYLLRAAHAVSFVMPADLRVRLRNGLDHIKHTNADWIKFVPSSHTSTSSP